MKKNNNLLLSLAFAGITLASSVTGGNLLSMEGAADEVKDAAVGANLGGAAQQQDQEPGANLGGVAQQQDQQPDVNLGGHNQINAQQANNQIGWGSWAWSSAKNVASWTKENTWNSDAGVWARNGVHAQGTKAFGYVVKFDKAEAQRLAKVGKENTWDSRAGVWAREKAKNQYRKYSKWITFIPNDVIDYHTMTIALFGEADDDQVIRSTDGFRFPVPKSICDTQVQAGALGLGEEKALYGSHALYLVLKGIDLIETNKLLFQAIDAIERKNVEKAEALRALLIQKTLKLSKHCTLSGLADKDFFEIYAMAAKLKADEQLYSLLIQFGVEYLTQVGKTMDGAKKLIKKIADTEVKEALSAAYIKYVVTLVTK